MAGTVINEEGVDVGTTPTVYAGQPANKLLCRINYSGAEAASAFTLGGTIGGDATSYFKIVKPSTDPDEYGTTFASTEFWIAYTSLRLPDTAAGTITFDGPTGLTTLNPTIVSSLGRPMTIEDSLTRYGSTVFALISTENWLRYLYGEQRGATVFQPVPDDALFPGGEFTANKPSDVASIMAGLAIGGKYAIRCRDIGDGAWNNTSVVWSTTGSAKDFTTGGGYVVIEPDPTAPPSLVGRYFITHAWQGVHIRGFSWPGASAGSGRDGFCLSCSGIGAQVNLDLIQFIDPDWVHDNPSTGEGSVNGIKVFVTVSNAKSFRVLRCNLVGANRDLTFLNTYFCEVAYNNVRQTPDDFCDPAIDGKHIGRWDSDDMVMMIHHNRLHDLYDKYTGKHMDFSQYSTTITYPGGNTGPDTNTNTYPASPIVVGDFRFVGSHVYKATIAGTTPLRTDIANPVPPLPSHTSGTALDGTDPATNPTFQYWGEVGDFPRQYNIVYSNVCITGGIVKKSTTNDHGAAQFLINSHGCPMLYAVFNNFSCTTEVLGLGIHCQYQTERNYFEYNSLMGPHQVPIGGFFFNQTIQNDPLALNDGKCRAYKNFCANLGATLFAEGNLVVRGKSPGAGQKYSDHCKCVDADFTLNADGVWEYTFQDDGLDTFADSRNRLSTLFHSAIGRVGARGVEYRTLSFKVTDSHGLDSDVYTQVIPFID